MAFTNPFKNKSKSETKRVAVQKAHSKKAVKEVEDRSVYNCVNCGGDGLVDQGTAKVICSVCGGTGKI